MDAVFIVAGLALLVLGGEGVVRGAVAVAGRLNLSRAFVGTVILGFGTSLPELVASFGAAAKGADAIAFGNVVGSNIANILLILGVSAVICPIVLPKSGVRRDAVFVGLGTLGVAVWIALGGLPRWGALGLLAAFGVYMWLAGKDSGEAAEDVGAVAPWKTLGQALGLAAVGIALLVVGAELLIRGGRNVAEALGVSDALIGILIVGVGTSLPEATASVVASLKGENGLAFANIVGSNVFNGLGILGVSALAFPLEFAPESGGGFGWVDAGVLAAGSAAMFAFALTRGRISRGEGAVFLGAYAAYVAWLVVSA